MDTRKAWKLVDDLNLFKISLLITGEDPGIYDHFDSWLNWPDDIKAKTSSWRNALQSAVRTGAIQDTREWSSELEINWDATLINVVSLKEWLNKKNVCDGFYIENSENIPGFAEKVGQYYAPKLAMAVRAWREVSSNPLLLKNGSPKSALEKWAREHAAEYGFTNDEGKPNEAAIEEVSKVANWSIKGGAPQTNTATSLQESKTEKPAKRFADTKNLPLIPQPARRARPRSSDEVIQF